MHFFYNLQSTTVRFHPTRLSDPQSIFGLETLTHLLVRFTSSFVFHCKLILPGMHRCCPVRQRNAIENHVKLFLFLPFVNVFSVTTESLKSTAAFQFSSFWQSKQIAFQTFFVPMYTVQESCCTISGTSLPLYVKSIIFPAIQNWKTTTEGTLIFHAPERNNFVKKHCIHFQQSHFIRR